MARSRVRIETRVAWWFRVLLRLLVFAVRWRLMKSHVAYRIAVWGIKTRRGFQARVAR